MSDAAPEQPSRPPGWLSRFVPHRLGLRNRILLTFTLGLVIVLAFSLVLSRFVRGQARLLVFCGVAGYLLTWLVRVRGLRRLAPDGSLPPAAPAASGSPDRAGGPS